MGMLSCCIWQSHDYLRPTLISSIQKISCKIHFVMQRLVHFSWLDLLVVLSSDVGLADIQIRVPFTPSWDFSDLVGYSWMSSWTVVMSKWSCSEHISIALALCIFVTHRRGLLVFQFFFCSSQSWWKCIEWIFVFTGRTTSVSLLIQLSSTSMLVHSVISVRTTCIIAFVPQSYKLRMTSYFRGDVTLMTMLVVLCTGMTSTWRYYFHTWTNKRCCFLLLSCNWSD